MRAAYAKNDERWDRGICVFFVAKNFKKKLKKKLVLKKNGLYHSIYGKDLKCR